jgi:superfamily II DNA/RNA helicase
MQDKPTIEQLLSNVSIESLNQMQEDSLAANTKASDVILLSPTGSGKTLGFLLPVFEKLSVSSDSIQALVLVPSRELALQIESVFKSLKTGFKVTCCYGGHPMDVEENNLAQSPALLIGTPGRIVDHINRRNINLDDVKTLVLDEFDKSLEMGFQEDMAIIIGKLTGVKKRILTSATQAIKIPDFTGMQSPVTLNYITGQASGLSIKTVLSDSKDKFDTLLRLLCQIGNESVIVFCNQRDEVENVCSYLTEHGIINNNFHGGLEQRYRESTLTKFRNGSTNVLVTTDLASRGLDIPDVKHVVHYQMPQKIDAFTHRNGRTARMGSTGTAYMLLHKDVLLPDYITSKPDILKLSDQKIKPLLPQWETLFISAGKKDKINKIDIVGFLSKKGLLEKDELGLIEVKDEFAYAAVKRSKVESVIELVKEEKIKGRKVKIEIARETPKFESEKTITIKRPNKFQG